MDERLPRSDNSVSVIGRFSVVFSEEKRTSVEDGHVYMMPIDRQSETCLSETSRDLQCRFTYRGIPLTQCLRYTGINKYLSHLQRVPLIELAWVVVSICYNVVAILTAVFISGFSGCMILVVPIYVSEICQESIRGTMTSGVMVFYGLGMLASYLMGGYLSYEGMIYVCLSMSVLGFLFLVLLKESPIHLMRKGLEKLAWVVVSICYNVVAILTAVFISGFSGCMILVVPIYVSEICQESIRGTMTSGVMVFYGLGMLASYLMGGYLSYDGMIYVCLSMSILGFLLLVLLKESPIHLMRKGLEKDAAKVIAYYRGVKVTSKTVEEEIQMIRRAMNPDFDDLTPEVEKLQPELKGKPKMSTWKFFSTF
ncbi:Facilitated trehalose transporter Tret1 [Papilio machaon]|uniref:Facilitated trehalose transporter Tret1 n=1 Tax=Papilio machaon TaxID=76193 RepID=A0A0N1IQ35_PAPMA|nr:Facilitated trehalose transporter Tret1 [Papilio machaon]